MSADSDWDGRRKDVGKAKLGLIPTEWIAALGKVFTAGAEKYDYESHLEAPWINNPMEHSRVLSSSKRHQNLWEGGETWDKETKAHHLAQAAWNLLVLMTYELHGLGRDDLMRDFWQTNVSDKNIFMSAENENLRHAWSGCPCECS